MRIKLLFISGVTCTVYMEIFYSKYSFSPVYRGTNHYYQSDVLFTFPSRADKSFTSTLDVVTAHRVNMDVSHAFLKRHLLMGECYYRIDFSMQIPYNRRMHIYCMVSSNTQCIINYK